MNMQHRIETPWGTADDRHVIAEGIVFYSTPSHGGIRLSDDRLAEMPAELKDFRPWAGLPWFEEDADCNVVVLAFPEFFTPSQVASAALDVARGAYYRERGIDFDALLASEHGQTFIAPHCFEGTVAGDPTMTTLDTITDDQIRALSDEAGAHGDLEMVAICQRALAGDAAAIAECVRVIESAEANN